MGRSEAMPHNSIDYQSILAWVGGVFTAGVGALGLWLANRLMGKAAFQQAINNGFKDLLDKVNADRDRLTTELHQEKVEAERERHRLAAVLADKEIAAAAERAQLRGEIINLTQVVESLKALLRANGIPVPQSKVKGPVASMIVMGDEVFKQGGDDEA